MGCEGVVCGGGCRAVGGVVVVRRGGRFGGVRAGRDDAMVGEFDCV